MERENKYFYIVLGCIILVLCFLGIHPRGMSKELPQAKEVVLEKAFNSIYVGIEERARVVYKSGNQLDEKQIEKIKSIFQNQHFYYKIKRNPYEVGWLYRSATQFKLLFYCRDREWVEIQLDDVNKDIYLSIMKNGKQKYYRLKLFSKKQTEKVFKELKEVFQQGDVEITYKRKGQKERIKEILNQK